MFSREKDPLKRRQAKLTSEGNYYGERGNLKRAMKCFKKAIVVDAEWVPAYLGLAIAYREQGQFQEALEVLKRAPRENFEIAFITASVLLVWNAQKERMGESIDTTGMIASINEALRIGAQPITEDESFVGEALGVQVKTERNEMMEGLRQSLTELS